MSPSEWSPRWDLNPVLGWSARGDSNPDLHGLNVPRLPIAPRAAMVTTGGFEPPLDRLSTCCLCRIGLHGQLVPLGGLEPPPHGLRARHAALTLQRGVERMTGFEPVPQGLEGPRATVTPHSLWFGLRVSHPSLHAGNVECIFHTQAEHGPVLLTGPSTSLQFSKTPLLTSWWAARDSNPIAPLGGGERGYGPPAVHPLVPPIWRQRQDSNPDPRALEARMLLLHHAADVAHISTVSKTQPPSDL